MRRLSFTISTPGEPTRTIAGDGAITIGRAPDNNVVLLSQRVSGYHAVIEHDGEGWAARDLLRLEVEALNGRYALSDETMLTAKGRRQPASTYGVVEERKPGVPT